ncbi:MAG: hypothetical protein WC769_05630 [Thermodesulfovibrionales bacterium]|jgi:hypothetical protein
MKKIMCALLSIVSLISSAALCYAGNEADQGDYVKILEIQPNPSVLLKAGNNIHFEVKIEYYVKEDSATVGLVIQKGESSGGIDPYIGSVMEVLTHGKGVVTLDIDVKVPDTKAVQVFTPLTVSGQTGTSTVDSRFYKVIELSGFGTAKDEDYQRQVKEYDARAKRLEEQQAQYDQRAKKSAELLELDEQLARKTAEQQVRFDKLLERWEKQADRYDAILNKLEKQSDRSN